MYKRYSQTLNLDKGIKWPQWFTGGRLNAVYNAVEKWARRPDTAGRTALIWESEDGKTEQITYSSLHQQVARAAAGFKKQGISKGDVIAIYMPMIPETVIAMLAAAKIGAVFSPVFSGYGAHAAAARLTAAGAKILVTADATRSMSDLFGSFSLVKIENIAATFSVCGAIKIGFIIVNISLTRNGRRTYQALFNRDVLRLLSGCSS